MFAVCVLFSVKRESMAKFLQLMRTQAHDSLKLEPSCHHFDICSGGEDPCEVFLYELYADAAAFDHHLATRHFQAFNAATKTMIARKKVWTYPVVRTP
ncbi:putative quinol monooxygenase [Halomonas sp. AOP5-B2-8]